jgi:hypothetical protein
MGLRCQELHQCDWIDYLNVGSSNLLEVKGSEGGDTVKFWCRVRSNFESCGGDPFHILLALRHLNPSSQYLATYVDDILIWSKDPISVIKSLE